MDRWIVSALAALSVSACTAATEDEHADHSLSSVVLEGDEITGSLDSSLTSKIFESETPFERLGVLWDAAAGGRFEARTSEDGSLWSPWAEPVIYFEEEGAFAGHVEPLGLGRFYQYRLIGGMVPTFVDFEPIESVVTTPDEAVAEEIDDESTIEDLPAAEGELGDNVAVSASGIRTRIGSVTVHSRASWRARSPRCSLARQTPNRVTIHHTVTPTRDSMSPEARLRQIQAFHMFSNGWCDIGYNFIVSRDGRLWRGRGSRNVGAHTEGANTGNVGISFLGNYTKDAATATQQCNSAKLIRYLAETYSAVDINRSDVKGHRQFNSTSCPGNKLFSQLDTIVRKARSGCN